jgi:hypothetical protein
MFATGGLHSYNRTLLFTGAAATSFSPSALRSPAFLSAGSSSASFSPSKLTSLGFVLYSDPQNSWPYSDPHGPIVSDPYSVGGFGE